MRASRPSLPPDLHLDLRESPGTRAALALWLLAVAFVLLFGTDLAWPARLGSLTLLVPAASTLAAAYRRRRLGLELARLCWAADGRWYGWTGAGVRCELRLAPISALLGGWMLLVLRDDHRRYWVPMSAARIGERAFRGLALRFALDRHRARDLSC